MHVLRRFAPVFAVLALLATPWPAAAWGIKAHRIVADLAERDLRPEARAQVQALLAGEPDPTLPGIANWADELRENDPVRGKATARWHYINFPREACEYVPARDCADGQCVVGAINRQFLVLADTARPVAERREALKFLVHFVGDVHQPLHAANGDDLGGNLHQLQIDGEGWNLHGVWDRLVVAQRGLEPPAYADWLRAQPPLPYDSTRRSDRPAVDWAIESCRIARSEGFYPPKGNLQPGYLARQQPVADLRMRQAGQRLADMLNFALAPARRVVAEPAASKP
jgi:hypothetical protein